MTTNTDSPTGDPSAQDPSADGPAAGTPGRPPRPATIRYSIYALALRGVFSVLAGLSLYGARGEVRTRLADANKTKGWTNSDLNHNVDVILRSSLLNAGFIIILLALVAKFVWDGRTWARWIYLAVIVLLAQDENAVLGLFSYHHLLPRILTGLTGIAGLASLVLLFLPASNAYFRPLAGTGRPGGLFGALVQPRSNPGARPPARAAVKPGSSADPEVSLTKATRPAGRSAAGRTDGRTSPDRSTPPAASARTAGPRGKSRQAPPKRPGGR